MPELEDALRFGNVFERVVPEERQRRTDGRAPLHGVSDLTCDERLATVTESHEASAPVQRRAEVVRAPRLDINGIQRLAAGHEQPVPPRPAEAHVGAGLRHPNHADAISVRSDHLNAGPCSRPDIAVHVASNAIGERRRPGPRPARA